MKLEKKVDRELTAEILEKIMFAVYMKGYIEKLNAVESYRAGYIN